MSWCWHLPHQHRTGTKGGEEIEPVTDTKNGREEKTESPHDSSLYRAGQRFILSLSLAVSCPISHSTGST